LGWRVGFLPGLLALSTSIHLAGQTAASLDEVYARLDKTALQFRSVSADIKRDVHTAVINDDAHDQGSIKVKHEKGHDTKMLIDFTGADAKTVSLDGPNVSVYYPKLKTVQIYDVGTKRNLVDDFLLLGFGASSTELRQHYDVTLLGTEMLGSDRTWHLQLVPKSPDALRNLKKAELWIAESSGLPVQQKFITSGTGDFTLVTYSNMKPNAPVSDDALKLNLPKGVTKEHPRL
jgi:outer membrane lipoprotein-sorting protein